MVGAYAHLPYGDDVPIEYGAIIYVRDGKYFVSPPIAGTRRGVRFVFGRRDDVAVTLAGDRIVELAHTHPADDSAESARFSGPRGGGDLGDVGIAEKFRVNVSLRYRSELRIYEPARMRPPVDSRGGIENSPGRPLCRARCFTARPGNDTR
jgi:hypothetical protein